MERTDVLCPRVGLEILQDHGFYNQSRFWLFFPGFCRRRRGRRKRRSIRRERRWRWCHRLFFFFFNLRHLSSCSLFLQQRAINVYLLLLFFEEWIKNLWEKRKQKKFCACVCLGLQFSKFSKLSLSSLSLHSSLFIFELARALKKRYKNGGRNATTT